MKFTLVVDVDTDRLPKMNMDELKKFIEVNTENSLGSVVSIGQGDQSNIGWHYIARWHEDDFAQCLEDNGVYVSDENIDTLLYACRHMDDSMVEAGWNYMNYVFGDCDFHAEFECEVCEEEITKEDNGICESCREELEADLLDDEEEGE